MWKYLVFFNYSAGPDYRRRVRVTDGKDDSIRHLNKRHTGLNRSFKIILFVHPVVVSATFAALSIGAPAVVSIRHIWL